MKKVGIDLGSRAVKVIVMEKDEIIYKGIYDTAKFYREYGKSSEGKFFIDIDKLGLKEDSTIVATGYGRNNLNIGNAKIVNELKAHLNGVLWQTKLRDFILLDIGGQDSKIIEVSNGMMKDILLNDKCAASCGRFLENMAQVIGIDINELSQYYSNPVELSSTCAVFGESELIGKISEGYSVEILGAGINYCLFKRLLPLVNRFNQETLVVSGGVAKNKSILYYLEKELLYNKIIVPQYPQLNGAIGCAILAEVSGQTFKSIHF